MKVFKHELVPVIKNLKTVLPKTGLLPNLHGILVDDGVLTASNTELTMQMTLEAARGERFIIPDNAFGLLENLPDGEIDITSSENNIRIQTQKIKNQFPTFSPDDFGYSKPHIEAEGTNVSGKELIQSLGKVEFACSKSEGRAILQGVYIKREDGKMDVVATDGHIMAWDQLDSEGDDMEIIVPQEAVKKLIGMGIDDDISLTHDNNHAIFRTEKYTIYTRLIEGPYINYSVGFPKHDIQTSMDRKELLTAVSRAKMCDDRSLSTVPIVLSFAGTDVSVQRVGGAVLYTESIQAETDMAEPLNIGFDGGLMIAAIKAFDSDYLYIQMTNTVMPVTLASDTEELRIMILPVRMAATS